MTNINRIRNELSQNVPSVNAPSGDLLKEGDVNLFDTLLSGARSVTKKALAGYNQGLNRANERIDHRLKIDITKYWSDKEIKDPDTFNSQFDAYSEQYIDLQKDEQSKVLAKKNLDDFRSNTLITLGKQNKQKRSAQEKHDLLIDLNSSYEGVVANSRNPLILNHSLNHYSNLLGKAKEDGILSETQDLYYKNGISQKLATDYVDQITEQNKELTWENVEELNKNSKNKKFFEANRDRIKNRFDLIKQTQKSAAKTKQSMDIENILKKYNDQSENFRHGYSVEAFSKGADWAKQLQGLTGKEVNYDREKEIGDFSVQPHNERSKILETIEDQLTNIKDKKSPEYQELLGKYQGFVEEENYLNSNGNFNTMYRQGLLGAMKPHEIDFDNPITIRNRIDLVRLADKHYGKKTNFLTGKEFSDLKSRIDSVGSSEAIRTAILAGNNQNLLLQLAKDKKTSNIASLGIIANKINTDKALTSDSGYQYGDNLASNVEIDRSDIEYQDPQEIINDIYKGKEVLAENPNIFKDKGQDKTDFIEILNSIVDIDSVYNDIDAQPYLKNLKQNVKSLSAKYLMSGEEDTSKDAIERALNEITGGIDHGDKFHFIPKGYGKTNFFRKEAERPTRGVSFESFLGSMQLDDIKSVIAGLTKEETLDYLRGADFISLGGGQYKLIDEDGNILRSENNRDYILDFHKVITDRQKIAPTLEEKIAEDKAREERIDKNIEGSEKYQDQLARMQGRSIPRSISNAYKYFFGGE